MEIISLFLKIGNFNVPGDVTATVRKRAWRIRIRELQIRLYAVRDARQETSGVFCYRRDCLTFLHFFAEKVIKYTRNFPCSPPEYVLSGRDASFRAGRSAADFICPGFFRTRTGPVFLRRSLIVFPVRKRYFRKENLARDGGLSRCCVSASAAFFDEYRS